MSTAATDGAAVVSQESTSENHSVGVWRDMETFQEPDGTIWITKTLCAKLFREAYLGSPPPPGAPQEIRWYELESGDLNQPVALSDQHVKIPGKIRTTKIDLQRPYPFQYRPLVYHRQDVVDKLKRINRGSLANGSWNA